MCLCPSPGRMGRRDFREHTYHDHVFLSRLRCRVLTFDTSHFEMSPFKDATDATLDTFHFEMSPLEDAAH